MEVGLRHYDDRNTWDPLDRVDGLGKTRNNFKQGPRTHFTVEFPHKSSNDGYTTVSFQAKLSLHVPSR